MVGKRAEGPKGRERRKPPAPSASSTRIPGLAPRFAAWRVLHDVRHGVPFDVALRRALQDLEPADRHLAQELAAGVFKSRVQLDARLAPAIQRGLHSVRADTLDVLRLGAFQLGHLDRVPAHAAVQTTAAVARRLGGRRVAGFVNAVLRRVAEPSTAVDRGPSPEPGVPSPEALADRYSHPLWLTERWVRRFGPAEAERLLQWNNHRPELVLQPARWTLEQLEAALRDAGTETRRAPWDSGLVIARRSSPPTALAGYHEGGFIVQDPAQALVLRFFAPPDGAVVYDACAAPGGKAIGLARTARLVVAGDRSSTRARRLATNLQRASPGPAHAVVADVRAPPVGLCDIVALDVPCLGTGVLARNPDARWRVTPEALSSLAAQARELLTAAAEVVRVGGRLLFATCSLEPEENEDQVEAFLARDPRFRREPANSVDSTLLTPAGDLLILPQRHGLDGAFAARLRKVDE